MKNPLSFALVFAAVAGFLMLLTGESESDAVAAQSADPVKPYKKPYKMVADLDVVMGYIDDIFMEMPDKLKANRLRKIRTEAMFLAELTNVTSYAEEFRNEKGWSEYMESMKKDFMALHQAAKKKDKENIASLHKKITSTCDSCHEKIRDA